MFDELVRPDLYLRLGAALVAGGLLGFDRGERGRAAGVRTMMLVSLAAATAMYLGVLWLWARGKTDSSFAQLDIFRMPLGILTGFGFIGAGAIIRRDDFVVGVTTAASMWLATVVGLCMGGGRVGLGFAATALGMIVLTGLRALEVRMKRDQHAVLKFVGSAAAPSDDEIRSLVATAGYCVASCATTLAEDRRELECDVKWRSASRGDPAPDFVRTLAARPGVLEVSWRPRQVR